MREPKRTLDAKLGAPKGLAVIASTTVAFALSRGMTLQEIEAKTEIKGLDLVNPDARLPDHVVAKLWRELMARHTGPLALSIEMARAAPFSLLGGLAHGAQFASTLRESLTLFVQNRILLADRLSLELQETETEAALIGSHPMDVVDLGRTTEVGVAVTARVIAEILHVEDAINRVEFSHEPFGSPADYERFFGVPVLFEKQRNALIFSPESMERPVRGANADLFAYVQIYFNQVLRRIERSQFPEVLTKLRRAILENSAHGDYRAGSAAARANLSLRSAQRLVAAHGTSLQALIEEVRAETAKEILSRPDIDIETVAVLVGYSDDRAFRRAFKRWTGQTPSTYRRSLRSGH
ncbi:MAG: AraC family transcriptional regulator ligand-binding domain-containing protein [Pseudomonadota bacterium]